MPHEQTHSYDSDFRSVQRTAGSAGGLDAGLAWGRSRNLKLTVWAAVAVYAALLARWSRTRRLDLAFPLALLLGAAFWPHAYTGYYLLALGVFSWIRSGICFNTNPLRAMTAELITMAGCAAWVAFWSPRSALAWALAVWLFFLVQTLYFFIVPLQVEPDVGLQSVDPFERAWKAARRFLEEQETEG